MAERILSPRKSFLVWLARQLLGIDPNDPRRSGGWIPLTCKADVMTCPMPADESVIEVMLKDGTVRSAWYACNCLEAGDWDFMPVDPYGEPLVDGDSLAHDVIAWRPLVSPGAGIDEELRALRDSLFSLRSALTETLDKWRTSENRRRRLAQQLEEFDKALQPFAALDLPAKRKGTARRYTIPFAHIEAARRVTIGGKADG